MIKSTITLFFILTLNLVEIVKNILLYKTEDMFLLGALAHGIIHLCIIPWLAWLVVLAFSQIGHIMITTCQV